MARLRLERGLAGIAILITGPSLVLAQVFGENGIEDDRSSTSLFWKRVGFDTRRDVAATTKPVGWSEFFQRRHWRGIMFDYRAEMERRIAQFAAFLRLMKYRRHEIVHGPCFIIFEEKGPKGSSDAEMAASRKLAGRANPSTLRRLGFRVDEDDIASDDLQAGWRGDDSLNRYVQFSFESDWFCMDLPNSTLFRPEAEEILRYRQGFFYVVDRPEFTLYGEDEFIEEHDPFRKIYIYGDEESAAADMAFIFFQVWKFPVEFRLFVSSAAFNGKHEWEKRVPIE